MSRLGTSPRARQHVVRGGDAPTYYGALVVGANQVELDKCDHVHTQRDDAQRCAEDMQRRRERRRDRRDRRTRWTW